MQAAEVEAEGARRSALAKVSRVANTTDSRNLNQHNTSKYRFTDSYPCTAHAWNVRPVA